MREIFEFPSASGSGEFSSHNRSPSESSMMSLEAVASGSNSVGWSSPRISFSTGFAGDAEPHVPNFLLDIQDTGSAGPVHEDGYMSQSSVEAGDQSSEFEFSLSQEFNPVSEGFMLPADELFFKGKLLPLQHSRRTQMVELLSSGQSNVTEAATTKSRGHGVHYYASPSPFPFPLAASCPQPVRCPPQETPSSLPFPYPIASPAPSTPQACAQPSAARPYLPLPGPRYRKAAKWKQVLRSLRKVKKEQNSVSADESDDACSGKVPCEGRRPKVLGMFFWGSGHGHGHDHDKLLNTSAGYSEVEEEYPRASQPDSCPDVGSSSGATESKDDGSSRATVAQTKGADNLAGQGRLPHLTCMAADSHVMGRSFEGTRPFKCRGASEVSSVAVKIRGGPGSPGRRSPGRGSPGRVSVKVAADKSNPGRNGSVGKIVLKNLERVSSPSKRNPRNKDNFPKGSEKAGSYTASVRVMPVLNVPSVSIKPVFRSSKLSPRRRLGELRHLFTKKEPRSPASSHR